MTDEREPFIAGESRCKVCDCLLPDHGNGCDECSGVTSERARPVDADVAALVERMELRGVGVSDTEWDLGDDCREAAAALLAQQQRIASMGKDGDQMAADFLREHQRAEAAEAALSAAMDECANAQAALAAARRALLYYATAQHLAMPDEWDSCSGEHSMWQFPDSDYADEVMIEGGWIARQALAGEPLDFLSTDGKLIDADEDAAPPAGAEGAP